MKHLDERVADITWRDVFLMICVLLAWDVGRNYFSVGLDATDKDAWHRSGVSIVVDYGTGQEYLVTPKGGGVLRPG